MGWKHTIVIGIDKRTAGGHAPHQMLSIDASTILARAKREDAVAVERGQFPLLIAIQRTYIGADFPCARSWAENTGRAGFGARSSANL